jgi:hypothetical protein
MVGPKHPALLNLMIRPAEHIRLWVSWVKTCQGVIGQFPVLLMEPFPRDAERSKFREVKLQ